eukprot:scaffold14.g1284.t1
MDGVHAHLLRSGRRRRAGSAIQRRVAWLGGGPNSSRRPLFDRPLDLPAAGSEAGNDAPPAEVYYVNGVEHKRYQHAILHLVGRRGAIVATIFQVVTLVLIDVAYTITGERSCSAPSALVLRRCCTPRSLALLLRCAAVARQRRSVGPDAHARRLALPRRPTPSHAGAKAMKTIAVQLNSAWSSEYQLALLFGGLEVFLSQAGHAGGLAAARAAGLHAGLHLWPVPRQRPPGAAPTLCPHACRMRPAPTLAPAPAQLPSLESVWWVSGLGTLSSLMYSGITLILGLVYAGNRGGTVAGIVASPATKAWGCLNAIGNIAFAFSFAQILLEIEDTLRQPPSAMVQMKKAIVISESTAFVLYFAVAVTSYAALGNDVPGEVLEGYLQAPAWPLVLANLAVAVHLISAYQVLAQPIFEMVESSIKAGINRLQQRHAGDKAGGSASSERSPAAAEAAVTSAVAGRVSPGSRASAGMAPVREKDLGGEDGSCEWGTKVDAHTGLSGEPHTPVSAAGQGGATNELVPANVDHSLPRWARLLVRTTYVGLVTLVACIMPFFSAIVGLVGSISFWPLCVFFPFFMWTKVYRPRGLHLAAIWITGVVMLVVSIAAATASIQGIVSSWENFTFFAH